MLGHSGQGLFSGRSSGGRGSSSYWSTSRAPWRWTVPRQPAVQVPLLHLELGDAIAEEAADAVRALEHGDGVAGAGELLGAGEPGGAGADDGDGLAGEGVRGLRFDPALLPGALDDR